MLSEKEQNRNRIISFIAVGIAFIVTWAIFIYLGGFNFICRDLTGHRAIVGYALKGYDPYRLIGKGVIDDFVGEIFPNFSTVPWALVFGAFFYPGYMPLHIAKIYLAILHVLFLLLAIYLIRKKYGDNNILLITFCAVSHFSFMYSVYFGNCGGVVSLMIICALLIVDEKPILAGLMMGIALLKPQISALFCLVWLLDRKIKPLIVSGMFCVAGWATASVFTKTNPLQLLKEMLEASTASDEQYLGLFSPIRFLGISSVVILAVNVIVGVAFTIILGLWLKKRCDSGTGVLLKYIPAAIASCFWIYKNGTDFLVLLIAVISVIEILKYCESTKEFLKAVFFIMCFELSRAVVSALSSIIYDNLQIRDIIKSAEGFVLGIIGIAACAMITQVNQRIKK